MQPSKELKTNSAINASAFQDHFMKTLNLGNLQSLHTKPKSKHVTSWSQKIIEKNKNQQKKVNSLNKNECFKVNLKKKLEILKFEEEKVLEEGKIIKKSLAEKIGLIEQKKKLSTLEWETLKVKSIERGELAKNGNCPICQEGFKFEQQVLLSCSHVFHRQCLESFERHVNKKSCPLCRAQGYEKRLIHHGKKSWIENCIVTIQKTFRMWRIRKTYLQYRQAYPPSNPILASKFYLDKLTKCNDALIKKTKIEKFNLDSFFKQLDLEVAKSKEIVERTTAEICKLSALNSDELTFEEWDQVFEKAKNREKFEEGDSNCSICLNLMLIKDPSIGVNEKAKINSSKFVTNKKKKVEQITSSKCVQRIKKEPKKLVLLSCSHVFHSTCLSCFEKLDLNIFVKFCRKF
ncbi:RING finger protein 32 [Lobulomyces angularis]|nr:RING finger protein 32 [Lobulomyces angularis]